MKILLDECVTKKFKRHLSPDYDVKTVSEMGYQGLKNGNLLKTAIADGFDMLLTIDKNMAFQHKISNYNIILVVFDTPLSKVDNLVALLPNFNAQVVHFKKRQVFVIS
jgi:predicted nuclease of predicted toxin-antitoxin system